jgi:hypothetical protein
MENDNITNETITRFKCQHLQEIRAVCELTEWSIKRGLDNGTIKGEVDDTVIWEAADDITQNALNIMEAFSSSPFTDAEYYILEGFVHDAAYNYLEKQGVTIG